LERGMTVAAQSLCAISCLTVEEQAERNQVMDAEAARCERDGDPSPLRQQHLAVSALRLKRVELQHAEAAWAAHGAGRCWREEATVSRSLNSQLTPAACCLQPSETLLVRFASRNYR
jgi:hypothetical protein